MTPLVPLRHCPNASLVGESDGPGPIWTTALLVPQLSERAARHKLLECIKAEGGHIRDQMALAEGGVPCLNPQIERSGILR
jgi:hypothetical protein